VLIADEVAASADLIAFLKVLCVAAFAWHAAVLWRRKAAGGPSALALAAATGLVWTAVLVNFLFKVVTMMSFNFSLIVSSLEDAGRTLVHTLGPYGVPLACGVVLALACASTGAARGLLWALRAGAARFPLGPRGAIACLGLICYFAAADLWYAANELVLYPRSYFLEHPYIPGPLSVPDYSSVPVRSRESVFIVQLESVNTLALFERTQDEAGFKSRVAQPGLETILREGGGVFFPFFWANSTQTNRAWETILCGVSGNLGPAMAAEPARLLRRSCLPRLLADAGYARVFLYSYFDLEFFNLRGFAATAGFQDVVHGPKLMAKEDRRHQWAYDDCVFYDRAFDYLGREGLAMRERVFAYFEVGMNHWPFINTMKHPQAHPYRTPATPVEHYVNALAEQDHCLLTFWKRFRELRRDDVHLFIVPDHSIFVRGVPLQPDGGFATWLAYVPPARRAAEFKPRAVLSPTPSQAQLYPTILELLGGTTLPGSFAFALRGETASPHYDDCQLLSEPFRRLVVRRGGERTELRLGIDKIALERLLCK
jgi:sulfatase-like protein